MVHVGVGRGVAAREVARKKPARRSPKGGKGGARKTHAPTLVVARRAPQMVAAGRRTR
jgi:hypothetical protein